MPLASLGCYSCSGWLGSGGCTNGGRATAVFGLTPAMALFAFGRLYLGFIIAPFMLNGLPSKNLIASTALIEATISVIIVITT